MMKPKDQFELEARQARADEDANGGFWYRRNRYLESLESLEAVVRREPGAKVWRPRPAPWQIEAVEKAQRKAEALAFAKREEAIYEAEQARKPSAPPLVNAVAFHPKHIR